VFASHILTAALRRATGARSPKFPPAAGAVLEALRLAGRSVPLSDIPDIKS
jgi:hypothetical protein